MSVILSREAYLEFRCFGMGDDYPKSTEQASSELRTRGCDSNVPALNYLIKQGRVQPNRNGRNYEWSADDIDQAARVFEEQGALTPQAHAFLWHGIHADVYHKALHEAWIKSATSLARQRSHCRQTRTISSRTSIRLAWDYREPLSSHCVKTRENS